MRTTGVGRKRRGLRWTSGVLAGVVLTGLLLALTAPGPRAGQAARRIRGAAGRARAGARRCPAGARWRELGEDEAVTLLEELGAAAGTDARSGEQRRLARQVAEARLDLAHHERDLAEAQADVDRLEGRERDARARVVAARRRLEHCREDRAGAEARRASQPG